MRMYIAWMNGKILFLLNKCKNKTKRNKKIDNGCSSIIINSRAEHTNIFWHDNIHSLINKYAIKNIKLNLLSYSEGNWNTANDMAYNIYIYGCDMDILKYENQARLLLPSQPERSAYKFMWHNVNKLFTG